MSENQADNKVFKNEITFTRTNDKQKAYITDYSIVETVRTFEDLKAVARFDHAPCIFKDNYRNNENFLSANCVEMDCDNEQSENPEEWITPEKLHEMLPDVEIAVIFSRNHMKLKKKNEDDIGKSARPRIHAYFSLGEEITDGEKFLKIKKAIQHFFPFFDDGANKISQCIYGVDQANGVFYSGSKNVLDWIKEQPEKAQEQKREQAEQTTPQEKKSEFNFENDFIPHEKLERPKKPFKVGEGRHPYLFKFTLQKLLSNADEHKAYELLQNEHVVVCEDLLSEKELNTIFVQAKKTDCYKCRVLASECITENDDLISAKTVFSERAKDYKEIYQKLCWEIAVNLTKKKKRKTKKNYEGDKEQLTTLALTQILEKLGLNLRFNVITGKTELEGDYPQNSPYIHPDYFKLKGEEKAETAVLLLPEFLYQTLKAENYSFTEAQLRRLLNDLATVRPYNPLEKMFTGEYDGQDRITELYKIMGIEHNQLYCTYVKKWLMQAVAMALNDGRFNGEFALCLQGNQGTGKTDLFVKLALSNRYFHREGSIDMRNKDSIIKAVETWIFEIGEANATFSREQSELKSFITAYDDTYRRPYGEKSVTLPRRTVFCCTVNDEKFLRDTDGGTRRWACVRIKKIDSAKLRSLPIDWYVQLWRQAYKLFCENPNGYRLTDEEREQQEAENLSATVPLKGEMDIWERLNWNKNIEAWNYILPSRLLDILSLNESFKINNLTPEQIGKALSKIARIDKRVDKKRVTGGMAYLLPPVKEGIYLQKPDFEPETKNEDVEPKQQEIFEPDPQTEKTQKIKAICEKHNMLKIFEGAQQLYQKNEVNEDEVIERVEAVIRNKKNVHKNTEADEKLLEELRTIKLTA